MVQPVRRIGTAQAVATAARAVMTPSDVRQFEAEAKESAIVRAFTATPEWAEIRQRVIGDGRPPLNPQTFDEFVRLIRWTADGVFDSKPLPEGAREAYLHTAALLETFVAGQAARDRRAAAAAAVAEPDVEDLRPAA